MINETMCENEEGYGADGLALSDSVATVGETPTFTSVTDLDGSLAGEGPLVITVGWAEGEQVSSAVEGSDRLEGPCASRHLLYASKSTGTLC